MDCQVLTRGVSLDRLQSFIRIVEAGSLIAAAKGDSNKQSLYSRQLRQLEEALEKRLFVRAGRSLRLTEDGRKLAVMIHSFFSSLDEFAVGGSASTLRLGVGESLLEILIYPRFGALGEAMPGVGFEFVSLSTNATVAKLATGEIELGIVRSNAELKECDTLALGTVTFDLVVPRSLLPEGEISALLLLKELPIASLSGTGHFVRALEALAEGEGWKLRHVAKADSFSKLIHLAKSAKVAAMIPSSMASSFPQEEFVRHRSKRFKSLNRSIVLAVHKQAVAIRPSLARQFELIGRLLLQ